MEQQWRTKQPECLYSRYMYFSCNELNYLSEQVSTGTRGMDNRIRLDLSLILTLVPLIVVHGGGGEELHHTISVRS